jgi:hypothetical protein
MFGITAAAQDTCGPAPAGAINFSETFKKGVVKIANSSNSSNGSLDIISDAFALAGDWNAASAAYNSATVTVDQARTYVQQEIKDQSVAIVSQCAWGMCKVQNSAHSEAAFNALTAVCKTAILGDVPVLHGRDKELVAVPPVVPMIFDDAVSKTVHVTIENHHGPIDLQLPLSEENVKLIDPAGHKVHLNALSSKQFTFKLLRPTQSRVDQEIDLINATDNSEKIQLQFRLIKNSDYLLPNLQLSCGTVNPNVTATAFSDSPSFPPKAFSINSAAPITPTVIPTPFQVFSEYHFNGGGEAFASVTVGCASNAVSPLDGTLTIDLARNMRGVSGHCCSGFGPGGTSDANPDWSTTIDLPADAAHKWKIDTSVNDQWSHGGNSKCTLYFDAAPSALAASNTKAFSWTVSGGTHPLRVTCQSDTFGVRPGNWDVTASMSDEVVLSIHVKRQ